MSFEPWSSNWILLPVKWKENQLLNKRIKKMNASFYSKLNISKSVIILPTRFDSIWNYVHTGMSVPDFNLLSWEYSWEHSWEYSWEYFKIHTVKWRIPPLICKHSHCEVAYTSTHLHTHYTIIVTFESDIVIRSFRDEMQRPNKTSYQSSCNHHFPISDYLCM